MTNAINYGQLHGLDENSDRLQNLPDDGYLWHKSHLDCYIYAPSKTGEFIRAGQSTGEYFLKADLFKMKEPKYGSSFWLRFNGPKYDAENFSYNDPQEMGAEYVPWGHIVQHLYDYHTDFDIKEAHTFWPYGTTEADVLEYLVEALNNGGRSNTGGATIRRDSDKIKTFFRDAPAKTDDKYTVQQLSDLSDLLGAG